MGTRSLAVEAAVTANPDKKLVLVLNKVNNSNRALARLYISSPLHKVVHVRRAGRRVKLQRGPSGNRELAKLAIRVCTGRVRWVPEFEEVAVGTQRRHLHARA
jgi:hypothetical protein